MIPAGSALHEMIRGPERIRSKKRRTINKKDSFSLLASSVGSVRVAIYREAVHRQRGGLTRT